MNFEIKKKIGKHVPCFFLAFNFIMILLSISIQLDWEQVFTTYYFLSIQIH